MEVAAQRAPALALSAFSAASQFGWLAKSITWTQSDTAVSVDDGIIELFPETENLTKLIYYEEQNESKNLHKSSHC